MTDATAFHPEDDLLAAEFALGLLEGDDLIAARDRYRLDAGFAAHVGGWHERLAAMADDLPVETPSAGAKRALLTRLFPSEKTPFWQRLGLWQGISFAAMALVAVLAVPLLQPDQTQVAGPIFGTQLTSEIDDLQIYAVLDPSRGGIALHHVAGAIPEGRVLELWAIFPDQTPVSLGVVPGDATHLALPDEYVEQIGQLTLAITDEPPGGAPGGIPSGQIRGAGTLQEI